MIWNPWWNQSLCMTLIQISLIASLATLSSWESRGKELRPSWLRIRLFISLIKRRSCRSMKRSIWRNGSSILRRMITATFKMQETQWCQPASVISILGMLCRQKIYLHSIKYQMLRSIARSTVDSLWVIWFLNFLTSLMKKLPTELIWTSCLLESEKNGIYQKTSKLSKPQTKKSRSY